MRAAGRDPGRFPCSLWFARRSRSPAMPLRPRREYAADLPRSLPGSSCLPPREFPARHEGTGTRRSRPRSARFEPVSHKGAVTRRFLAYSSPSRLPDPDHLAVLARPGFVRAAPALPGTTRVRLPSAPPPCCDRDSGEGLPPPLEPQRLTAHPRPPTHRQHLRGGRWRGHQGPDGTYGPRQRTRRGPSTSTRRAVRTRSSPTASTLTSKPSSDGTKMTTARRPRSVPRANGPLMARSTGNAPALPHSNTRNHARDQHRHDESGRRESNPHDQLGRSVVLPAV